MLTGKCAPIHPLLIPPLPCDVANLFQITFVKLIISSYFRPYCWKTGNSKTTVLAVVRLTTTRPWPSPTLVSLVKMDCVAPRHCCKTTFMEELTCSLVVQQLLCKEECSLAKFGEQGCKSKEFFLESNI